MKVTHTELSRVLKAQLLRSAQFAKWRVYKLTLFFIRQGLVQGLSLVFVILLGHLLATKDYAVYMTATTVFNGLLLLTAGSIGNYFSGYCYRGEEGDIARVMDQCARKSLFLLAPLSIFSAWFLVDVLSKQAVEVRVMLPLLILVPLLAACESVTKLLNIALISKRNVSSWQAFESLTGASRLILLGAASIFTSVSAVHVFIVLCVTSILRLVLQGWVMYKYHHFEPAGSSADIGSVSTSHAIWLSVQRQMPTDTFHALHPQLLVWLLATRADPSVLAGYGLLSRLAQFLAPVNSLLSAHVFPRLTESGRISSHRIRRLILGLSLLGVLLVVAGLFGRHHLVKLLGGDPSLLSGAVGPALIFVSVYFLLNAVWSGLLANGFNKFSWLHVPATIVMTGAALLLVPLDSVSAVFHFQLICCLAIAVPVVMELRVRQA
jgi:hypothetical protein